MAKFSQGDRVVLHPGAAGQHLEYEGRTGVVLHIEPDTLHHHLGGIAQYRVQVDGETPEAAISLSERELTRARRAPDRPSGPGA